MLPDVESEGSLIILISIQWAMPDLYTILVRAVLIAQQNVPNGEAGYHKYQKCWVES